VADHFTIELAVADLEEVRKALGWEKVAVVGHSMHALMALEYAKRYPARVSHAVMIAMAPNLSSQAMAIGEEYWRSQASDERKEVWTRNQARLTPELLSRLTEGEAFIARYVADGPRRLYDMHYDASWMWKDIVLHNMKGFTHIMREVLPTYDVLAGLGELQVPVFLAVGRHDYGIPPHLWDDVRHCFTDLTYLVFEHSGHHPMLEEPERFDSEVIAWVNTHRSAAV